MTAMNFLLKERERERDNKEGNMEKRFKEMGK